MTEQIPEISLEQLKEKVKKKNDTLMDFLYIRRLSLRITKALLKTNITPNQITALSTFLYFFAAYLFTLTAHHYLIVGAIALNLGIILDCVDGELARAKNMCSRLGYWLDHCSDWAGQILVIAGIFIGQINYLIDKNIFWIGVIAILNIILINVFIYIKLKMPELDKPSIQLGAGIRIGFSEVIFLITVCALLNQMIFVLWVCATILSLVWIKSAINILLRLKHAG